MPSLDTISEWALENLYLVGAVTGVVLLVVLLILLLVMRRGGSAGEQAGGREDWRESGHVADHDETDVFGETLLPAPTDVLGETLLPAPTDVLGETLPHAPADVLGETLLPAPTDVLGETLPPAPALDVITSPPSGPDAEWIAADITDDSFAHALDEHPSTDALIEDTAEHAYPPPAAAPATPPETLLPAYVPPTRPLWNHARDIVQGLVHGQGDITVAELRRLDLVRPEKVLEAVDELDASLQGGGKESQRARLAKIRRHAETLMPGVAGLGVVEAGYGTPAPGDAEEAVFEIRAAEQETAAVEPERDMTASEAWDAAAEQSGILGDSPDRLQVAAAPTTVQPLPEAEAAPPPMEPIPGAEIASAPAIAPLFTSTPNPVIGEAAAIGPTPAEPTEVAEVAPERPAAEDVLGLEQSERATALRSLTPKELGRLFSATDDQTAKLSIIDALVTMPGVETMSVIQLCLDDPDPEVQLRALEAAERLLTRP